MSRGPFHGPRERLEAARSPDATPEDLRSLAASEYDFVRLAVAEHPRTPADVLGGLVPERVETWNEQAMLLRLASHPSTPLEALLRIAAAVPEWLHRRDAHQVFAAGVALFRRPDVPEATLRALLEHPSPPPTSAGSSPGDDPQRDRRAPPAGPQRAGTASGRAARSVVT